MRKQFKLPEADDEFLAETGLQWELVRNGGLNWLIIHKYPVPKGYNQLHVSLALMIPAGYPDAEIDMVYFNPALARADKGAIRALTSQSIDGKSWQRWSRHRTGVNPWRPGVDDVQTHLRLVDEWLRREIPGLISTAEADVQLKEVRNAGVKHGESRIVVRPKPKIRVVSPRSSDG